LAAAVALRERLAGKQVAAILSGGNISPAEMELCLRETADPTQSPLAFPAFVH
jgi:threonine dehydratase